MVRIFVQRSPQVWNGKAPSSLLSLQGWDVSVESVKKVYCKKRTIGFLRAIELAAQYVTAWPRSEVVLPQDLKNVQVVG